MVNHLLTLRNVPRPRVVLPAGRAMSLALAPSSIGLSITFTMAGLWFVLMSNKDPDKLDSGQRWTLFNFQKKTIGASCADVSGWRQRTPSSPAKTPSLHNSMEKFSKQFHVYFQSSIHIFSSLNCHVSHPLSQFVHQVSCPLYCVT